MESFQSPGSKLHKQRFAYYWWTLSFQAGAINAGGLLSCGRGVSHVTGFGGSFGVNAAEGRWGLAMGLLSVPLFFLLGSIATSAIKVKAHGAKFFQLQSRVLVILFFLLFFVFMLGSWGYFGAFKSPLDLPRHYILLALLSFVCGMQNALFSGMDHGVIRSTHLTGTLTDLGVDIGRGLFVKKWLSRDREMAICRAFSVASFIAGALSSSYIYLEFSYWGFVLPMCTALLLASDAIRQSRKYNFVS